MPNVSYNLEHPELLNYSGLHRHSLTLLRLNFTVFIRIEPSHSHKERGNYCQLNVKSHGTQQASGLFVLSVTAEL